MYSFIALSVTVVLSPILIPLGLYIVLTYHWEDTVPSEEDLDYEPKRIE